MGHFGRRVRRHDRTNPPQPGAEEAHTPPCTANPLKIQPLVCRIRHLRPYQKCKATSAIWLTREAGPDTFARKSPRTARRACFRRSSGMRARIAGLSLSVFLGAAVASAQNAPRAAPPIPQIDYSTVNCSGFVTDQKVPDEIRLVSGEQSNYKITFARGDYVHINRGQDKGVRVGDVLPKVSIAQVIFSCDYMQRGDILVPYQDRPAPAFKDPAGFDHFAPVSGKPVAMVVAGKDYSQVFGKLSPVYVNLGSSQGVKVGDYFRIFRYQGSMAETVPQNKGYQ